MAKGNVASGFVEGFIFAFLNPKIILFFLAILGTMLPPDTTVSERGAVAAIAMTIDAGWYTFAAIVLSTEEASRWLRSREKMVAQTTAAILAIAGIVLLYGVLVS